MQSLKLKKQSGNSKSLRKIHNFQSEKMIDKLKPPKRQQKRSQHEKNKEITKTNKALTQIKDKYYYSKQQLQKVDDIFRKESKIKITSSNSNKIIKTKIQKTRKSNKIIEKKGSSANFMIRDHKTKKQPQNLIKKITSEVNLLKNKQSYKQKNSNPVRRIRSDVSLRKRKHHDASPLFQIKKQTSIDKDSRRLDIGKKANKQYERPSIQTPAQIQLMDMKYQGTYGKILIGKIKKTGEIVAIKRVLLNNKTKNKYIEIISLLRNDFIVDILGTYTTMQQQTKIFNIIMRYYQSNLSYFIKQNSLQMNSLEMKIILYQIFKALSYLHSINICHLDIKPQNILIKGLTVALCDFTLAKVVNQDQNNFSYLGMQSHHSPELAFGATACTAAMDIWSVGCIILQMINKKPIFKGGSCMDHIQEIINYLGTPTPKQVKNMNASYNMKQFVFPWSKKKDWGQIFPRADRLVVNLIDKIMVYSPQDRISAIEALSDDYFDQIRDQVTYAHIKSQYCLRDFFNFSPYELRGYENMEKILIPSWYSVK